jgi:hypothetical protein
MILKAVLAAMTSYFAAMLKMPRYVEKILGLTRKFFWTNYGAKGSEVKLVAWKEVCRPLKEVGLGVREVGRMNDSLLTKWLARLLGREDYLVGRILRLCYEDPLAWDMLASPPRGV